MTRSGWWTALSGLNSVPRVSSRACSLISRMYRKVNCWIKLNPLLFTRAAQHSVRSKARKRVSILPVRVSICPDSLRIQSECGDQPLHERHWSESTHEGRRAHSYRIKRVPLMPQVQDQSRPRGGNVRRKYFGEESSQIGLGIGGFWLSGRGRMTGGR